MEDVKTFLRIAIVIAVGAFAASTTWILQYPQENLVKHLWGWNYTKGSFLPCLEGTTLLGSDVIFVAGYVPLYEFILYPLFNTCIPHIGTFKKFTIGVVLCLLRIIALLIMEALSQVDKNRINHTVSHCIFTDDYLVTNVDYHTSGFLGIFTGLSYVIMFTAAVELICSQSPYAMKGLILGLGYGTVGLYTLIHMLIGVVFKILSWKKATFSCGFWYFLLQIILLITVTVVLLVIIKCVYKKRQREDVLPNEQAFAIQYYEKYATGNSSSSEYSDSDCHSGYGSELSD